MQSLVTPDGELEKLWRGTPVVGSLEELQAQRLLLQLGNEVVAARNDKWSDAWQQLKEDLQVRWLVGHERMPCGSLSV